MKIFPLFCSLPSLAERTKTEMFFKTYSAEMEDMFGVPLRALRKTNGSVHGQKAGLTMSNSPSAQTISPPVLTSVHGTPSCANSPSKSPCPHPPSLQKGTCNRVLFSALFIWEDSNNIATVTKARRKALQMVKLPSRAVSRFYQSILLH